MGLGPGPRTQGIYDFWDPRPLGPQCECGGGGLLINASAARSEQGGDRSCCIVVAHSDDCIFVSNSRALGDKTRGDVLKIFDGKDLGKLE